MDVVGELGMLASQFGPWAGIAFALAIALRALAEASRVRALSEERMVAQLRQWIDELRGKVRALEIEQDASERRSRDCEQQYAALASRYAALEGRCALLTAQLERERECRLVLEETVRRRPPNVEPSAPQPEAS